MRRDTTIKKIKDKVTEVDPTATVILYGSQARGDARLDSDIDILILVDSKKPRLSADEREKYTFPIYDIEYEDMVNIHPIVYTKYQWEHRPFVTPFYLNVMREGTII